MKDSRPFKKQFQRILTLLLVFSMLLPGGHALAYEESGASAAPTDKIEPELRQAMENGGMTSFIVTLKDKADPALLAERAVMMDDGGMTSEELEAVVRGQVVLGLQAQAEETQVDLIGYLNQAVAAGEVERFKSFYITNAISVVGTAAAAEAIAAFPEVEAVVLDEVIAPPPVEVEPVPFVETSEGSSPLTPWNLSAISQDKVRDELKLDGTGVVVGIIDTGVDGNHPALKDGWRGNDPALAEYSWLDLDYAHDSPTPTDYRGHGTHVCGTIMGRKDNNGNYLGVAPGAQWIAARVFDDEGASQAKLIEAGEWMLAPKGKDNIPHPEMAPDIVNNSWGGNTEDETFYMDILKAWREAGIVPVFAAGNASSVNPGGDGSIQRPASYAEAFAVGALKKDDGLAKFSLRGPSEYASAKPDVSAPGVSIRSSMPGGGYGLMSGTSMACPHVAGAFAILKQAAPEATVEQLENAMRNTCTPLTDSAYVNSPNNGYGYGKINVYNAVKKLQDTADSAFGTFSGHIYEAGEDVDSPVIKHAPINQMFTSGSNTPVDAQISDGGGVAAATLRFAAQGSESWTEREMHLHSGTKREGVFRAEIARTELVEGGMQYQIIAHDNAGKTTETEIFQAAVASGISIGYDQDFETNIDGIEFGGVSPIWEWGEPTSGPMAAKSGTKCMATNLDGSYKGLIQSFFVLPIIDLTAEKTGGKKATLSFQHWYDMDNYMTAIYETAEVWIAVAPDDDSELNYQNVRLYQNSSNGWKEEIIDLTPYDGQKIYVMFAVRGDLNSPQRTDGWYVDDIKITEATSDIPEAPVPRKTYKPDGTIQLKVPQLADNRVSAYRMYRSTSESGPFVQVDEVLKSALTPGYSAYLNDKPVPQTGTYYYYATALIGENESPRSKILTHVFTEGDVVAAFDFEDGPQGWTSETSEGHSAWTHGDYPVPEGSAGGDSRPSKKACESKNPGLHLWATEMTANRYRNTTYTLTSDTIDLSQVENGTLYYQNWFTTKGRRGMDEYGTDLDEDRCYVYFSKDNGQTWGEPQLTVDDKYLSAEGSQGQHIAVNTWYTESIQIPAEYQVSTFKVKFELEARTDYSGGGWYIDDVMITKSSAAAASAEEQVTAAVEAPELVNMMPMGTELRVYGNPGQATGYLPVDGTVTILETGSKYYAEVGTGVFTMDHPVGTFTAVAECRGYQPETFSVTIGTEPVTHDFVLAPASRNSVTLKVVTAQGTPIADAVAFLTGPADTFRVKANVSGEITIPGVYAGSYLLNLSAKGYETKDQVITVKEGQDLNLNSVTLQSITTQEIHEMAYDDGTPDSYLNSLRAGRAGGIYVKNESPVVLDTLKFMFVTGVVDFQTVHSEGKPFEYAIYEDDGFDGLPGRALVDFTRATAGTDGQWTEVKVPGSVVVNGNFYIAYRQVDDIAEGTLLGVDDTNQGEGRNFLLHNGGWIPADEKGVYMIRADVKPIDGAGGETEKTIVDVVSSATLPLEVQEGDKVLDTLTAKGVQIRINYSDGTHMDMPIADYLPGAEIKLNAKPVTAETTFAKNSELIVIKKDGYQVNIQVQVTANPDQPDPEPELPAGSAFAASADLRAEKFLNEDQNAVFSLSLKDPANIYAVEVQLSGTGTFKKIHALGGFTMLTKNIKQNEDGTFAGSVSLAFTNEMLLAAHDPMNGKGMVDILSVQVAAIGEEHPTMTIGKVKVAGSTDLDHGNEYVVKQGVRTAAYDPMSRYDLNNDGKVSLGDIAIAVSQYRANSGDADWEQVKKCDVNRDNTVNVADFVEIALHTNA